MMNVTNKLKSGEQPPFTYDEQITLHMNKCIQMMRDRYQGGEPILYAFDSQEQLYVDLGLRIRALRRAHHFTQAYFAKQIFVSTSFLGHIERGTRKPSIQTITIIADALNTTLDYLVLGIPPNEVKKSALFLVEILMELVELEAIKRKRWGGIPTLDLATRHNTGDEAHT